ncbi:MAG: hypothetical protein P8N52_01650 [Crocinitomicaceae bacterium]|nr:hypothetical protein [Crocinitomicaceae bacterium]MDG1777666.1 hypothetical protein [Crocinitomicaceae bacterium]
MGRPATKPARLKDGFYIEVKNQGSGGILIRRDTKDQMLLAAEDYSRMKQVTVLGEMKSDKWVNKIKDRKKKKK